MRTLPVPKPIKFYIFEMESLKEKLTIFNQKLNFNIPIKESVTDSKDFIIKGTAINATTTKNNHTFLAEELIKSVDSLKGKVILKDHINSVDNIVGRVTQNVIYDHNTNALLFEGKIVDKVMIEKISSGLVNSVSVGASVREIEEGKDGNIIARGIEFDEISLVAVPADPNANFTMAMLQSLSKERNKEIKMEKKEIKVEETKIEDKKVVFEMPAELTATLNTIAQSQKDISERLSKIEEKPIKDDEEDKVEEKASKLDETKGIVGDDEEDKVEEGIVLERVGKGFAIYQETFDSKFRKLNRGMY